jgi:hypothetical protein
MKLRVFLGIFKGKRMGTNIFVLIVTPQSNNLYRSILFIFNILKWICHNNLHHYILMER